MKSGRASEIAEDKKHKTVEPEDIIKALNANGFESYVDAFKKGLEERKDTEKTWIDDDKEDSEEETPKKKKRDKEERRGKAKKDESP